MRNRKATRNFWTDDQMIDAVSAGMEAAAEYSGKSASVRTRIGNESAAAVLGCKATDVQAILTAWEAFNNA
jgi:ornithine carbamoyltransferase